ncbi:hypothetical protein COT42_03100 [Candidatus Saganbacteria bacterium CG08_land_8_20_14_0_20_45_16]|uniref:SPOR domain-containing protein n=1 Tax=Candidatus Saganbacteria bacterium CG08_land_8_20_14_0_20_45_16 TaxID=2014293 RepID=A0A2H0XZD6_UNCSA|nr:MAG: hypothetical protein COT42_03100 [Candidatus Saganbacteria bacterium CG08_land_8_20_14_0_20_45_16]
MEAEDQEKQNQPAEFNIIKESAPRVPLEFLKRFLGILLLLSIIVGSFWLSFQFGKNLLVPSKSKPATGVEVVIPEVPDNIATLQKEMSHKQSGTRLAKKTTPGRAASYHKQRAKPALSFEKKLYKVQVGVFSVKANAKQQLAKLQTKGFEAFLNKVAAGWRVQAGAYTTKKYALLQQKKLTANGFASTLIYE